jgi:hypothetical protein
LRLFRCSNASEVEASLLRLKRFYASLVPRIRADEFPVERYYRDVRVTRIHEGTSHIQKLISAGAGPRTGADERGTRTRTP